MDYRLVLVKWEDSFGATARWESTDSWEDVSPLVIESCGRMIKETAKVVVIAPHFGGESDHTEAQASGVMVIPKSCIVNICDLTPTSS